MNQIEISAMGCTGRLKNTRQVRSVMVDDACHHRHNLHHHFLSCEVAGFNGEAPDAAIERSPLTRTPGRY
jgi:hypothetical protein